MKFNEKWSAGILMGVFLITLVFFKNQNQGFISSQDFPIDVINDQLIKPFDKRTRMDLAMLQQVEMMRDPALGVVPSERLLRALTETESQRKALLKKSGTSNNRTEAAISGVNWVERGPTNVGGRTRAILIDANDGTGNTIFAAGVSGGLWKTTDITAATPTWTIINDFFANMAITCIAQDPNNAQVMYFGTGEGYFNSDAVRGNGIWKSTNGGTTWTQLASTITTNPSSCAGAGNCNFDYVQSLVVTSTGAVVAATRGAFTNRGGIMRSSDGGATWTKTETGLSASNDFAADVVLASNGDLYSSFGITTGDGIYKSTNDGVTWSRVYTALAGEERIELGVAPSDNQTVYALIEGASNQIGKMIRTTNGGGAWTTLANTSWSDQCAAPVTDFTRGQAFYDLCVAVDPNNRDNVFIGGVDLFKSTNGGVTSWSQITEWSNCSALADIHADQHIILFASGNSNIMYVGNDGGIYRTTNATSATPSFANKGSGYRTTQFYGCAMHPTALSNHFLAGAQDNGSQRFSSPGLGTTVEVTGGDGAYCNIDQDEPQYQFTQYIYNNFRRSINGGASFTSVNVSNDGKFINPSDYDDLNNRMYSSTLDGFYKRWDDPQSGSTFTNISIAAVFTGTHTVSAVRVSPNTANRVFFGSDEGRVIRVDNAHTGTPTVTNISTGLPTGYITCVEVETGNDNHLLVTYSNYGITSVWESTNGGTSWTSVEGDLPDMPIRWAIFSPINPAMAMVATELGVWSTDNLNGGATDWDPSVTGLANVRVDMLQWRASDKLVIAASHGRGLFSSDVFALPTAEFAADKRLDYIGNNINFTDASLNASSWLWNFGDGNTSTTQHPVYAYSTPGLYTVTLTINGGVDVETKVGYIHILPNKGTPYAPADGGNFEVNTLDFGSQTVSGGINLWERGTPVGIISPAFSGTNVWKTDLDANIPQATYQCALQTPNYNMSAAGAYTLRVRTGMETQFCNAPSTVQVHYSTDKGATWTRLGAGGDGLGSNWYNTYPGSAGCSGGGISATVVADQTGWTFTGQWFLATYNISFLAGNQNVTFRFIQYTSGLFSAAGYRDGFAVDDFEITGPPNAALPVDLGTLAARYTGQKQVSLNWETFSENNSAYFEVERSEKGKQFTKIGQVQAKGNSASKVDYEYKDFNASLSLYYYRLKLVNRDGSIMYSEVVVADRDLDFEIASVYPQPFHNKFTILFTNTPSQVIGVKLYDETGREYYTFSGYVGDRMEIEVKEENLSPGYYYLIVSSKYGILRRKVLKY